MIKLLPGLVALMVFCPCHAQTPSPVFLNQFRADAVPTQPVRDQPAITLSLDDAVALGLRNNLSIRSTYLDRVAQRFDLRVAEDQFAPQLTLNAAWQAQRDNDNQRNRRTNLTPTATLLTPLGTQLSVNPSKEIYNSNRGDSYRNDGVTFSIIQPLLRGAGQDVVTAPLRQARLAEQVNRINQKQAISQVILQVVLAWRTLLQSQQQLEIAKGSLKRSQDQVRINDQLIKAGRVAELDRYQTEADEAEQALNVEDTANQIDDNRLALLRLLNLDLGTPVRAAPIADVLPISVSTEKAWLAALDHSPDYLKQLIAGQSAELNLIVAQNDQLWDVSLNTSYGQTHQRPGDSRWELYGGVNVSIPIGDLSRQNSEVQARVAVRKQAYSLTDSRQELRRSVVNDVRSLDSAWARYRQAQKLMQLTRKKAEAERLSFQAGTSSNFQLLSYEADLRNSELVQLDALMAYLNAQTQLWDTLGLTLESWNIEVKDEITGP